ncbi:MAG: hypothetical protein ACI8RD_002219 [Bacillariaceae sp.]|jgi:hypothetical protein
MKLITMRAVFIFHFYENYELEEYNDVMSNIMNRTSLEVSTL